MPLTFTNPSLKKLAFKKHLQETSFELLKDVSGKSQLKLEEVLSNRQGIYPHPVNLISSLQRYQDGFLESPCCRK